MTSSAKNCGPFRVLSKSIRATLKRGQATLKCEVQKGKTPMGRSYQLAPQWWIKMDSSPCASGPWTADAIRKYHAQPLSL
jgi:hypothetical protein